jgi:D-alanine-D-alanine ligase
MLEHLKKDPYFRILRKKRIGVLMGGRSAEREVSLVSGRGVMASLKRLGFDCMAVDAMSGLERKITDLGVQIAFTALHGRWGEDGSVQGLLEYMNVPYTGSGVHASALAMNKISAKRIFKAAGVPTAPFLEINTEGDLGHEARQCAALGFPLIVKPNDEGSSIGCHIVKNRAQLVRAIQRERRLYPKLFAEKYV